MIHSLERYPYGIQQIHHSKVNVEIMMGIGMAPLIETIIITLRIMGITTIHMDQILIITGIHE